jgi:hypothetical protein
VMRDFVGYLPDRHLIPGVANYSSSTKYRSAALLVRTLAKLVVCCGSDELSPSWSMDAS